MARKAQPSKGCHLGPVQHLNSRDMRMQEVEVMLHEFAESGFKAKKRQFQAGVSRHIFRQVMGRGLFSQDHPVGPFQGICEEPSEATGGSAAASATSAAPNSAAASAVPTAALDQEARKLQRRAASARTAEERLWHVRHGKGVRAPLRAPPAQDEDFTESCMERKLELWRPVSDCDDLGMVRNPETRRALAVQKTNDRSPAVPPSRPTSGRRAAFTARSPAPSHRKRQDPLALWMSMNGKS